MATFTLGSSSILGDEFSDKAAAICAEIHDQDTLYLDRVEDAAIVRQVLDAIHKKPKILPSSCSPEGFKPPIW